MAVSRIRVEQVKSQSTTLNHLGEQLSAQGKPHHEIIRATEGQLRFTVGKPYQAKSGELRVFLNGQKLNATSDPTKTDGDYHEIDSTTIEFTEPLFAGDIVEFSMEGKGQGVSYVVDHFHVNREKPDGPIDGVNKAYFLVRTPKLNTEMVFVNGRLMNAGIEEDYTISGNKITFNEAPTLNTKILVNYEVSYVG